VTNVTPDRSDAAALIIEVVTRCLNPAEWADVEAWIEMRSEDEGGFLWLVAALRARPSVVEQRLRALFDLPPAERYRLRQRLIKARANGNGTV
jgi:hypothetical protein